MKPGADGSSDRSDPPQPETARLVDHEAPSIPDHRLLRRIGHGSYGDVWLAQNIMGRYRAVKIVYRNSFQDSRPFERELSGIRRFEPVSRSHAGFIHVLHVGSDQGKTCFYYVMELGDDQVSGQDISPEKYAPKTLGSEITRRGQLPFQEVLQLGLTLSQTLVQLHEHGLVHRDIKPSNIIFVNGAPKLADIGLVAETNAPASFVGTAGFIPPEGPGSEQADIYSLGKVLYEASTGSDRQDFPVLPANWDTSPEHDGLLELNEVILRACHHTPAKRYSSAADLQADLALVAGGKSIKRLRTLEQRWRRLKHATGVAAVIVGLAGLLSYSLYREWTVSTRARQQQVGANLAYGNKAMETGDYLGALPYFARVFLLDPGSFESETSQRLRFGSLLAQCPKLTQMWNQKGQVNSAKFSPDGKKVLVAEFFGKCRIYDLGTGHLSSEPFGPGWGLSSGVFSPDGQFIATAGENSTASIWDAADLTEEHRLPHPDSVFKVAFSPDGGRLITSCKDGLARIWDAHSGELKLVLRGHAGPLNFAAFSHDGRLIATGAQDGTARIWDATDGHCITAPIKHGRWVTSVCFSPDDHRLVTTSDDHRACVWELPAGRRILPGLVHQDLVRSAEFSPDGKLIVTASLDGTARLWSAENLEPVSSNPVLRHGERVTQASFSPDGRSIVTCCVDGSVRIWDFAGSLTPPNPTKCLYSRNATRCLTLTTNGFTIVDALTGKPATGLIKLVPSGDSPQLTANGRFVFRTSLLTNTGATNRVVQIWEADTGTELVPRILLPPSFISASLSEDARVLLAYGGPLAQLWQVTSRNALANLPPHDWAIKAAVFNHAGTQVATVSGNKVLVWDTQTGRLLFPGLAHPVSVESVEYSPNDRLLVSCCSDNQFTKCFAQVWNAENGRPVGTPLRHGDGVLCASFSPDSRRVVTASEDFTARIWDSVTGQALSPPLQHGEQVQSGSFSHNGKWLVTSSNDRTARLWSADTFAPLTPPLCHLPRLFGAKFLPDDTRIITTDTRQTWSWTLPIDQRPVEDILAMAQLLSANSAGSLAATNQAQTQLEAWNKLRAKYPADFSTTAPQVAAWHDFQARQAELQQQWFAAAFHLERLSTLRPADPELGERLARARAGLKEP